MESGYYDIYITGKSSCLIKFWIINNTEEWYKVMSGQCNNVTAIAPIYIKEEKKWLKILFALSKNREKNSESLKIAKIFKLSNFQPFVYSNAMLNSAPPME